MRLRSHPALTISSLPPEVLHRISEVLDATHPRSLVAFAQTSKHLYVVASSMLFRTIKITLTDRERLAKDVQNWEAVLVRDEALQHVRRLILCGYDLEDEHPRNPYLSLEKCERSNHDTDLLNCWDLYLDQWGGKMEPGIKGEDWELLARLLKRLTGLTDFFFACPGPFPPPFLQILHQGLSRCRLHHYSFRLSASDEASLRADERSLITSPCLATIGDLTADFADASKDVASRLLARQNAPSLRRVFSYWRGPTRYADGSREVEVKSGCPIPPALEYLQIFCHSRYHLNTFEFRNQALTPNVIDNEVLHNYSALQVLKLNCTMMDLTLPAPTNFPSLVTFSVVCPKAPLDPAWSSPFLAFLRELPRIEVLRVLGWDRSEFFTPGLNERLQELHLATRVIPGGKPLLEDHVLQLADKCPALEDLTIEIKRSRGDAAEVARYRALGRLPRLRRLKLSLDAAPPGIIPDEIIEIPSRDQGPQGRAMSWRLYYPWPGHTDVEPWFEDDWDSESAKWGLVPHRNGNVRDALVNSAIDSALALSIVDVLNSAKEELEMSDFEPGTKVQPLERVEMEANNGGRFPQMTYMSGPAATRLQKSLTLVKRKWLVERDVRDDSRDILHVLEVNKDERIKAQARSLEPGLSQGGDDDFREIWQRVWPATNTTDRAAIWWEQWKSWPLDVSSADKGKVT